MLKFHPKTAKTIFFTLTIIFVVFLSELIYFSKTKPSYFSQQATLYYLKKSQYFSQKNNLSKALKYFEKATQVKINNQKKLYPNLIPKYIVNISLPNNSAELNQVYLNYLNSLDIKQLYKNYSPNLAKEFFNLGLINYQHNQSSNTILQLWQTAIYLAPQWSNFHTELANYYFYLNQNNNAKEKLEYCLKFEYPKKYCQNFIKNNLNKNIKEKMGFTKANFKNEIFQ